VAKRDPSVIVGVRVTIEGNDDDDDETNSTSQIEYNAGALVPQNSAARVPYNPVSNNTNQGLTSTSSSQTTLTTFTLKPSHLVERLIPQQIKIQLVWSYSIIWRLLGIVAIIKKRNKK